MTEEKIARINELARKSKAEGLTEAEKRAIDQLDLGYSEILDYGNPCIARMFLKKRDVQAGKDDRGIL